MENSRLDLPALNDRARALHSPVRANPANHARCRFLDPAADDFYPGEDESAPVTSEPAAHFGPTLATTIRQ